MQNIDVLLISPWDGVSHLRKVQCQISVWALGTIPITTLFLETTAALNQK